MKALNVLFLTTIIEILYSAIKKRNKTLILFTVMFICGVSPYMQLFPLDMTVAARWFYYPFIGFLGICGYYLSSIIKKSNQKIIYVLAAVILVLFSLRTFERISDWKNGLTLYSRDILYSRNSFDLENNLGVELFRKGDIDNARMHFKKSTEPPRVLGRNSQQR
jgi:hypothetical protein